MAILTQRNFLPLFVTQLLGVFNDNVFKAAITMLVTYRLAESTGISAAVLVTLGGGIYILPYALFSGIAGQLADKFEKTNITRWVKVTEVLLMLAGLLVLLDEHLWGLYLLLFLMGTHSAFFGPIKYGILPQALPKTQLIAANGLFEASTFLAILIGTMYGGVVILQAGGAYLVGITCSAIAVAGLVSSYFIPEAKGVDPKLTLNKNFLQESLRIVAQARSSGKGIMSALMCISWFWLLGAVILSFIPVYGAQILHGDEFTTTFLLSLFSVGIAVGSILCQKLVGTSVNLSYVPVSGLLISLSGAVMVICSQYLPAGTGPLRGVTDLLAIPMFWPIMVAFVLLAMAGGVFTVPLYAFIQATGNPATKSRLIAANNVLNAIFMVSGAIASSILLSQGVTLLGVLGILMVGNLFFAAFSCKLLSHGAQQKILRAFFNAFFRVEVIGLENAQKLPKRLLVICNHTSFLDAAILAIYLPVKLTFAIDELRAKQWWIRPFLFIVKAFPLSPTNPYAIRNLINLMKQDVPCMIFPEGRLSQTGALMKVYDGAAMVALNAEAALLPVYLEGLQFSKYNTHGGRLPQRWFPKVTLTIHPLQQLDVAPELRGRARRIAGGQKLQNVMTETMFASSKIDKTLFTALLEAADTYGPKTKIINDINQVPLTYKALIGRGIMLGRHLQRTGIATGTVGLLLPNANAAAATFFAMQAVHVTPAMLNFSAGPESVISACKTALVTQVLTSRAFIEKAKLADLISRMEAANLQITYLEDVRAKLTLKDKLTLLAATRWPRCFYKEAKGEPNTPAAILFTSGSEGTPKGVVLSHRNFIANVAQAHAVVDFTPKDTLINALPMFHSFGLTGGTLLPILYGVPTVLYPSPLHYRIVPEFVYNFNATIMFGTDTFLTGYARYANPYDFYRMRYVFAGAEKVRKETRDVWMEKFGIRILEGYGATETSPVLSLNTPMAYKLGAVGKLVPGMEWKLGDVDGVEGGNLMVKGPNVMLGYYKSDAPGKLQPPKGGWHDTGDVVTVDENRFITIQGRLKRFAKIGGEMISLGAAEALASSLWPDSQHAVVAQPDARKGEQLVLFTTQPKAKLEDLRAHSRKRGGSDLALPRTVAHLDKLPTLATGKVDYVLLNAEAAKLLK